MTQLINKNIKYIIGIDLGHGETSAAICDIDWDSDVARLTPVRDIILENSSKVLPSAITILESGEAYIGKDAFNPDLLSSATVHIGFKRKPMSVHGTQEEIMIRYMHEVYQLILQKCPQLTETNHVVYIATPSGWSRGTQKMYIEMAEIAEIPIAGVTKESRAAFVRAQHDSTSGLGRNIEKGAIVFDMGSSTLDFTYMNKEQKSIIDHGYDVGASFIEKAIYDKLIDENKDLQLFQERYPQLTDSLRFEARQIKEQVYFSPNRTVRRSIYFDEVVPDDQDLNEAAIRLTFNPGELNEFLADRGYLKQIEDAMIDYRQKYIHDQSINGVFLTGGASRMDFIIPLVCNAWDINGSLVYRDDDPSLTISQGVAEVARIDLLTKDMDNEIAKEVEQLKDTANVYDLFASRFGARLAAMTVNNIDTAISRWAGTQTPTSLNALGNYIDSAVQSSGKISVSEVTQYIEDAINEVTAEVRRKFERIISAYSAQGIKIDLTVKEVDLNTLKLPNIDLSQTITEIAQDLDGEDWGAWIGNILRFGGNLFQYFEKLQVVGMILNFIGQLFPNEEKSEEEKRYEAMNKNLSYEKRQELLPHITGAFETKKAEIRRAIKEELNKNTEIKASINDISMGLIQSYQKSLEDARVMIE